MSDREVITRGDLPHWYLPGAAHFVTYRLADTLPFEVLRRLRAEREASLRQPATSGVPNWIQKTRAHKRFFAAYDQYLDEALCVRWLAEPAVANVIIENLYHHHQIKYQLLEYTVMPNHVHVLFVPICADAGSTNHVADAACVRIQTQPTSKSELDFYSNVIDDARSPLSEIMHSLKSYTANQANKLLSREGKFWQRESYDHWIRDDAELDRIREYIANNAVRAKLAANAWDWPYCSAYDRIHPRDKRLAECW